ncbi:colorectal cancer associated 2 [Brienomyrus brachyistius]|uniref:colorectal cancer associated 2 n=1 Tax=Brienomyrus brachyistius TaxID=42636 RepID=UPI0020B391D3|nr:colorectal cancer associated 2 [Brienomyrus brachyistius]
MSDKPKVYQGVRVKATVRELLQKQRARQAAVKSTTISQNFTVQDDCATPIPAHHFDVCSGNSIPDASYQTSPYIDNFCDIPMETSTFDNQYPNVMFPQDSFNSILPADSSVQHWAHGHFLSTSDYHINGMVPSAIPDSLSLNLPSPDYNSFSPPDSYSSSSSCYSSPSRMDSNYGFVAENYHYQHCSLQRCYCLSHWSGPQDSPMNPEYASDCLYTAMDQSYFRRDVRSSEMCYL